MGNISIEPIEVSLPPIRKIRESIGARRTAELNALNISLNTLRDLLGVSPIAVQWWVKEGKLPRDAEMAEAVRQLLDVVFPSLVKSGVVFKDVRKLTKSNAWCVYREGKVNHIREGILKAIQGNAGFKELYALLTRG